MKLASWIKRLGTETAFEVLARARNLEAQGREVVHLEIGEPDFDTPRNIRERAKKALDEGYTHYGPSAGLPDARAAIAEHISKTRKMKVEPEQVVITPGGKPIMFFAILALIDPGDEVIYPNPGFPIYESMINFVGGKAVPIPIREENEFDIDLGELTPLLSSKTKLIILNSPANPTGGILSKETVLQLARMLKKFPDITILSDEIYSQILYEGEHFSIASLPEMKDRTIILDGFSKTYAMTGWRAGYGVMPKDLSPIIARLMTNSNSCTATFTQLACIEALKGPQDEVKKMVLEFRKRRDVIVSGLNKISGFSCKNPHGAFYVFPNIIKTGKKSKELADLLLEKAGVACLSGTAFGSYGEGYLRFSYANSVENILKAIKNIEKLASTLG